MKKFGVIYFLLGLALTLAACGGGGETSSDAIDPNVSIIPTDPDSDGLTNNEDADDDGDGIADASDTDADGDGTVDSADPDTTDTDGDGVMDSADSDDDGDGTDDALDDDDDGDGIADAVDPDTRDTDGDGLVDSVDTDDDGDGVVDSADPDLLDSDGDGTVDSADPDLIDSDGDGTVDASDAFPSDATETTDTDGDTIGNNADTDDDDDGTPDASDALPLDATETTDTDSDGIGNNADTDDDGDGCTDGNICVTTTDDSLSDDGFCSLREAVRNANNDSQKDNDDCQAGSGDDTIIVPGGNYVFSLAGTDDLAAKGDLDILSSVTIVGADAASTVIDANSLDRVLYVATADSISVTLQNMTLKNGSTAGGGIYVLANSTDDVTLTLENCHVEANSVSGSYPTGGGIYILARDTAQVSLIMNGGSVANNSLTATTAGIGAGIAVNSSNGTPSVDVNLNEVSIDNNAITASASTSFGAGIYFSGNTSATNSINIVASTISQNTVSAPTVYGGAAYFSNVTANLLNSTLYANASVSTDSAGGHGRGGALWYSSAGFSAGLGLYNVTVTKNSLDNFAYPKAGGIYAATSATITLNNSILFDNDASATTDRDCYGTITSVTATIIGDTTNCTITSGTALGDDPSFGTFGDNGGPTQTLPLNSDSAAINAGGPSCFDADGNAITTDQRGEARSDGLCDLGAYEVGAGESP